MQQTNALKIVPETPGAQLDHIITDGRAWTTDTINTQDCIVPLSDKARDELKVMADLIEANPLPVVLRHPSQFHLPEMKRIMAEARQQLECGTGVAVIDRLPIDELGADVTVAVFWILGHFVEQPVAQKWQGTMLYDVTDTGTKYGYGVRGSATSVELVFHTDNAFGLAPPDYVGLLCHYPAKEGGLSRFCSLYSVHNRMLEKHPRELARLYEPVLWDRQAEHVDGAPKVTQAPMFQWNGERLSVRANTHLIQKGYDVAGIEVPADMQVALQALRDVTTDENLWFGLPIERGQLQYLNNQETAHYRSEFIDQDDPAKKRHLVRTWHRGWGAQTYDG